MKLLVTGTADFKGFHVSQYRCNRSGEIVGYQSNISIDQDVDRFISCFKDYYQ